jgi:hypothetical protein
MDFNSWSKCLNGTSTAWALLLLQALGSEARQSFSVKNENVAYARPDHTRASGDKSCQN